MTRQVIIYTGPYDVRFSDLDPYGHMNAKHYLDVVTTTRMQYSDRVLGQSMNEIAARGIGFFLVSCTQKFRKPIVGMGTIKATSYVEESRGASFTVVYQITSMDEATTYSDGTLEFAVIDLNTQRPILTPEWIKNLFYKSH